MNNLWPGRLAWLFYLGPPAPYGRHSSGDCTGLLSLSPKHLPFYYIFFSHTCNTWSPRSPHLTSPSFSVSFFLICLLLNLLLNTFHKRIMIKGNVHIKYQFLHIPREGPGYQAIAWVKSNWNRQSACYQAIILGLQRFLFKVSVPMTRTQSMYSFSY